MRRIISIIAVIALASAAHAQQRIETFTKTSADPDDFFQVLQTDLIEVISVVGTTSVRLRWAGNKVTNNVQTTRLVVRGITGLRIPRPGQDDEVNAITVRITPAGTTPLVSPPVVVPVSEGKATISIEASTDLMNWFPAGVGEIPANSPARFFRLKAVITP